MPRRRRETTTRHVSSAGTPTSSRPMTSACHSAAADEAPIITSAAIAKPIGMLPPSPRKIRADGRERLCGRKPRQAPHSAAPVATSQTSDCTSPSTATAAATTPAIVLEAPSMLSKRLNALTTATTHSRCRQQVDRGAEAERPAEVGGPQHRRQADLDRDARPDGDEAAVVERAHRPQDEDAAEHRQGPVRLGREHERDEHEGRDDRRPAEVRGRRAVALVAGGDVVEVEVRRDADRHGRRRVGDRHRQRQADEQPRLERHVSRVPRCVTQNRK